MGRKRSRLTEQCLVPFEAACDVGYPYDRPRALHWSLSIALDLLPANELYHRHSTSDRMVEGALPSSRLFTKRKKNSLFSRARPISTFIDSRASGFGSCTWVYGAKVSTASSYTRPRRSRARQTPKSAVAEPGSAI